MKTHGDLMYDEIKGKMLENFRNKDNIKENFKILKELVEKLNINKCQISEIEISYPDSINYLVYLLQNKKGINFGLCEKYKCWFN